MILLTASEDLSAIGALIAGIASMGTVGLLYGTFALQYRIFKEQQKLTREQLELSRIEHIKYRKMFMPQFTAMISWDQVNNIARLYLNLSQSNALSITIIINNGSILANYADDIQKDNLAISGSIFILLNTIINEENTNFELGAVVSFTDENGEPYIQRLIGTLMSPELTPPVYQGE